MAKRGRRQRQPHIEDALDTAIRDAGLDKPDEEHQLKGIDPKDPQEGVMRNAMEPEPPHPDDIDDTPPPPPQSTQIEVEEARAETDTSALASDDSHPLPEPGAPSASAPQDAETLAKELEETRKAKDAVLRDLKEQRAKAAAYRMQMQQQAPSPVPQPQQPQPPQQAPVQPEAPATASPIPVTFNDQGQPIVDQAALSQLVQQEARRMVDQAQSAVPQGPSELDMRNSQMAQVASQWMSENPAERQPQIGRAEQAYTDFEQLALQTFESQGYPAAQVMQFAQTQPEQFVQMASQAGVMDRLRLVHPEAGDLETLAMAGMTRSPWLMDRYLRGLNGSHPSASALPASPAPMPSAAAASAQPPQPLPAEMPRSHAKRGVSGRAPTKESEQARLDRLTNEYTQNPWALKADAEKFQEFQRLRAKLGYDA